MNLLRAEWTKFRTVRGWALGVVAAAGLIMVLGLAPGMTGSCGSECVPTRGPDGTEVTDSLTFVHQPLTGDGSVTVRLASLTGTLFAGPGAQPPGLVPWAKAGLMVRGSTTKGSTYAAVMLTGSHGIRMQYDYTHDVAGRSGGGPLWLRLSRTGETVTAAESADGSAWSTVGSARLPDLPATAEVGLFATSPQYFEEIHQGLSPGASGGPSQATGTFEQLAVGEGWSGAAWHSERLGGMANEPVPDTEQDGSTFRVTGSGDIGPAVSGVAGLGVSVAQTLVGTFAGLIVVVVLGAVFVTTEYRRGLIRTTLSAGPRRLQALGAKATVIGGIAFITGTISAAIVVFFGQQVLRANGVYVHPASSMTQLRIIVGTGALLALATLLAFGLGVLMRRSVTAVTTAVVLIVLPYLLAMTVLPSGAARWLLSFSPAAAFALQQAVVEYPQVDNMYAPINGYFPLAPWAGFAVLAAWTALVLAAAAVLFRRRDV